MGLLCKYEEWAAPPCDAICSLSVGVSRDVFIFVSLAMKLNLFVGGRQRPGRGPPVAAGFIV